MKKTVIFAIVVGLAMIFTACGGTTKEDRTPRSQTADPVSNIGNTATSTPSSRNDADADDKAVNKPASNSNANRAGTKRTDLDDVKKSGNTKPGRTDSDDRGKSDSDRDDDDQ